MSQQPTIRTPQRLTQLPATTTAATPRPATDTRPAPPSVPVVAEDVVFTRGAARRPLVGNGDPLLQWATGLTATDRTVYAGWMAEAGRHAAFDDAMAGAGFETITIKHGSGNLVTHWAVETATMFVIAEGVQSIGETKHTSERYGIAFGWRSLPDGRPQSVLKFRVFLRELLEIGYTEPILVSVKSTLTGDLLTALMHQYDALDAIDALRVKQGKPALHPPFYACSIALGPGQEVQRGGTQKRALYRPSRSYLPRLTATIWYATTFAKNG